MQNVITGLIAPKGSGKSYSCAEIMARSERCAVYQIVLEDAAYLGAATDVFSGEVRRFCRALGEEAFRYLYRIAPGSSYVEDGKLRYPDFELFVRCCFERGNMTMIIDEAHLLCSAYSCPPFLWESVLTGRHKSLSIVYATQRFAMVTRDITANTDEFYFWNVIEPADLKGIADRCGREVADKVQSLRRTEDNRHIGGVIIPGERLHWTTWEGVVSIDNSTKGESSNGTPQGES